MAALPSIEHNPVKETQRLTGLKPAPKVADSSGEFAAVKKTTRFEAFGGLHHRNEGGYVEVEQQVSQGTAADSNGKKRQAISDITSKRVAGFAEPVVEGADPVKEQPAEDLPT